MTNAKYFHLFETGLFNKPENEAPLAGKYILQPTTELSSLSRNHQEPSFDIVKEFIAGIKNNNFKYNAILWYREKEALEKAKKDDKVVASGVSLPALRFHGIVLCGCPFHRSGKSRTAYFDHRRREKPPTVFSLQLEKVY